MSDELIREAAAAFHRQIPARRVGELEPARACASAIVAQWIERVAAMVALRGPSTWLERQQLLEDLLTEVFAEWAKGSVIAAVEKFCRASQRNTVEFASINPESGDDGPQTCWINMISCERYPGRRDHIGVGDTWGAAMAQALDIFEAREDEA